MKREIITISEGGVVNVPVNSNVQMADFEIAQLLGIMVPTVRGAIKRLLKGRTMVDCSGGVVRGNKVVPEYFGLEVVVAVAFQVDGYKTEIFRNYILRGASQHTQPIYINIDKIQGNIIN